MILNLLMLIVSITYIINHSGIIVDVSKFVYKKLNPGKMWMGQIIPKPFSCAICLNFWLTFIISLFNQPIILSLFIGSVCAIITSLIDKLLTIVFKIINKIQ